MKLRVMAVCLLLAAAAANAQRHSTPPMNDASDGQLMRKIAGEVDETRKLALLEEFASGFPKHEALPWIYEQMVTGYSKAGQFDKALDAGTKLLAIEPSDVFTAHDCLKAAEAKKDPDLVMKWSQTASDVARKVAAEPKPAQPDQVEDWSRRVDFAKQADTYTEYSLYAAILQTTDPAKRIALGEELEKRNPTSQYLALAAEPWFLAYYQAGQADRALAVAERFVARGNASVEMLLAAADGNRARKQYDRALDLAEKAAAAARARPKPEGAADADWEKWKAQMEGRAHYTAGMVYIAQSKWTDADKELRTALPAVAGDNEVNSETLFYLGFANYQLAEAGQTQRATDALRFSEECSKAPGRYQETGAKNVRAIRAKYKIK